MPKFAGDDCVLVVVDLQQKFAKAIPNWEEIIENTQKAVKGCQILDIPIIVTEQYPQGLGKTVDEISSLFTEFRPIPKNCFSCYESVAFKNKIENIGKTKIILCGIETHICIYNTAVDLIDSGYEVYLMRDALASRKNFDAEVACEQMKRLGAKDLTVEMFFFQILKNSKMKNLKKFKNLSNNFLHYFIHTFLISTIPFIDFF